MLFWLLKRNTIAICLANRMFSEETRVVLFQAAFCIVLWCVYPKSLNVRQQGKLIFVVCAHLHLAVAV